MCLIKYYKSIIKSSTSHICKRCHLYKAFLLIVQKAVRTHYLIKSIIKRPQIRIYLTLQISRQKSEFLSGLNSRSCKNNPVYGTVFKSLYRHSHSQICLTRTGRSYTEDYHLVSYKIHILLLTQSLRLYRLAQNSSGYNILIYLKYLVVFQCK